LEHATIRISSGTATTPRLRRLLERLKTL